MRKEYYRVLLPGGNQKWEKGIEREVRFEGLTTRGLLAGIDVIVEGTLDLGAANATAFQAPGGGIYNLIKNMELVLTDRGVTPALGLELQEATLINLPGYCFGYRGAADETPTADERTPPAPTHLGANSRNRMQRINLLQPSRLLMPTIDFSEPDPSDAAAQKVKVIYRIPFTLPDGRRPSDLWLDLDFVRQLQLNIICGDGDDVLVDSANGGVKVPATFAGDISVLLQSIDVRGFRGTGHASAGLLTARINNRPIEATQSQQPIRYNTTANILYHHLITQVVRNGNYEGTDGILQRLRLQRNDREKLKLPVDLIRAMNARQFFAPGAARVERAEDMQHILTNSGLFTINGFGNDYDERKSLAMTPFQGAADSSAFLYADWIKPAADTRMLEVLVEMRLNAFFKSQSRPLRDLNAIEQRIAMGTDKTTMEKAAVQAASRNLGTPT